MLSNTDVEGATVVCDKLRHAIATPEQLLRGADRALYAGKSPGRSCVRALRALEAPDEPRVLREPSRATSRHEG